MDADGITRHPLIHCPQCGYKLDAAGVTDGAPATPSAGDASACIACGCKMVFIDPHGDGTLTLRRMTDEEVAALSADERRELDKVAWFATHVYQPGQRARTAGNN